jgi:beta-lactamase regulating signal transducer with metallopeptidase domain
MIAALINHLWQSTLFCGGVWLITLMLRANSAALRHSIWLIASLKFLVPFSLLFAIGSYIGLPAVRIAGQPLMFGDALQSVSVLVAPGAPRATETATNSIALIALLAIWLAGALILGLRWLVTWRAADSIARAARPAPGALPDTRVTEADIEPAVARVFHPVVLLPAALLGRLSAPQMNALLAHEHEHIARRDNLKANAHRVVETLFWFHPVVWWMGRQMLEERERACDEAVLESGHDRADYAGGILEVCRHCRARAPLYASAASGDLTRRVRYILGSGRPASVGVVKFLALAGATVVVATAPLFAGAAYGAAHRLELLAINSRTLGNADIYMGPAAVDLGARLEIDTTPNGITIRNSSLRDLVAFVYRVRSSQVTGGPWLDDFRYDIRVVARDPLAEPDELDPYALRELTNKLLASQFDFEIYLNQRCQLPCGRYAQTAAIPTR